MDAAARVAAGQLSLHGVELLQSYGGAAVAPWGNRWVRLTSRRERQERRQGFEKSLCLCFGRQIRLQSGSG